MNKLTIEHVAPYLPYALNISLKNEGVPDSIGEITGINEYHNEHHIEFIEDGLKGLATFDETKLILRPLSQITDYFKPLFDKDDEVSTFLGDTYLDRLDIEVKYIEYLPAAYIPLGLLRVLLKHHFDVFGLIDKGLAVEKK